MKKKNKTICFWCGKSHKKTPAKCKENSLLMSRVCEKVETWKAMRALEVYGIDGLRVLGRELGGVSKMKNKKPKTELLKSITK